MKNKYPIISRIFIVFPVICIMGPVWATIGLFNIKGLGRVLKQTGENFLKD